LKVREGARKHGISDEDMRHAVRYAVRFRRLDEQMSLLIGADTTGRLLEVVVAEIDTDRARIIHAMPLRRSFYRFL
jgi:hypothetical protein